jgi:hypothetical protein
MGIRTLDPESESNRLKAKEIAIQQRKHTQHKLTNIISAKGIQK